MNTWTRKNALWLLLYVVLYVIATVIVCVLGSVHAALFVCYQITAALIVTGVAGKAFDRIKAPGVAACLGLGMILTFFAIGDANLWHCIPIIVITALAELVRGICRYKAPGNLIASVIMSFSSFGYYGQIWFNRDYTYECAVEEMPAGYADALMQSSPAWALPVVIIAGIALSVVMYSIAARLFRFENKITHLNKG